MFEWDEYNAHEEANLLNCVRLTNMKRMFFLNEGFMKLEDVNFLCFPTLTILKLSLKHPSVRKLNLKGLKQLKSLEIQPSELCPLESEICISIVGLGSLLNLTFLRWLNISSISPSFKDISRLTKLQVLELDCCDGALDVSNLILLRVASFCNNSSVATIDGFSSKHTNLQFLELSLCPKLQSCPGLGELVALQELNLNNCLRLEKLPNLQRLKQLQKLLVDWCPSLQDLPGLGELVALQELNLKECYKLEELPNLQRLKQLQKLLVD